MDYKIRLLMVEDCPSDAELVKHEIRKNGISFTNRVVETEADYVSAVHSFKPELIISDYNLPIFNGMRALRIREELAPEIPFILVTGTNNEEIAVECMKSGADDYILKDNLKRLGEAIKSAIRKKEIIRSKNEAEEKLKILSLAVEQNPACIVITSVNGTIEYVNPKFTQITGYTAEEAIGKNPRILNSGFHTSEFYQNMWVTIMSGKEWIGELQNKKKNGELYWENALISPLLNEAGQIMHLVAIKEDITEKRRMIEDMIIAKEKAEAGDKLKTAFINNISHEIRTPLSGIVGFSEMILSPDISIENKTAFNEIIKKSSGRLMNTISNYLDISLLVSGNMEVRKSAFFLNNLLQEISDKFSAPCEAANIKLKIQKPELHADLQINSDTELLMKVFSHLIDNALKFTQQGEITFGYIKKDKALEFFVNDTGVGIEPEKTKQIFDYFMQADVSHTRRYEGSGLGLSISGEMVKLLGGHIHVKSAVDKGSSFYFSLPLDIIISGLEKDDSKIKQAEWKSKPVILVAEDDDFNYKYLEIVLKRENYFVLHAANGSEAVDICHSNPEVNLILMDMKMPVMGGLEATRRIKAVFPDLPIIALTAFVSARDESEALDAGCIEFLTKPVNKPRLLASLQKHLGIS
jgi:PAS domain S-box-containing protein